MQTTSPSNEPLGLTVYSLPDPRLAAAPPTGRGKLLAIVLASTLPLMLALFVFFVFKPTGKAGFGELIQPARAMPEVSFINDKGENHALADLKGKWLLVTVDSGNCLEACAQHLFVQRQLRAMLGKDKDRVERVWIVTDNTPLPEKIQPLLTDLTQVRLAPEVVQLWLGSESTEVAQNQLYLVDPIGNAMLKMSANQNATQAKQAHQSLMKLLAASAAWQTQGH